MTHPVVESEVWAHFATLRGYVKNASEEDKASYKFQYRKSGTTTWKDVAGEVTVATNGSSNVAQVATNLDASTNMNIVCCKMIQTVNRKSLQQRMIFNCQIQDLKTGIQIVMDYLNQQRMQAPRFGIVEMSTILVSIL